ncbi:MAG: hypothetical protein R3Y23_04295 [Bacillota bacterium]
MEGKGQREEVTTEYVFDEEIKAPIKKGDKVGEIIITSADGTEYARVDIVSAENVEKMTYVDGIRDILKNW